MKKPILYVDMDGVVADFYKGINKYDPEFKVEDGDNWDGLSKRVDTIVTSTTDFFLKLDAIDGAVDAINQLWEYYDIYFLSTPMWHYPPSYTQKRLWLEGYFGDKATKRLILTHRKDLCIGDYLIDDTTRHGAGEFKGTHIHFGTEKFPNWEYIVWWLNPL
jgi:5'-nucleotidase